MQAPGRPSPFANMQGGNKDGQPMNLQNLASMFSNSSTPLTAADLQKYQSAGLNMSNFPSLPSVRTHPHPRTCPGMLQPRVAQQRRLYACSASVCPLPPDRLGVATAQQVGEVSVGQGLHT